MNRLLLVLLCGALKKLPTSTSGPLPFLNLIIIWDHSPFEILIRAFWVGRSQFLGEHSYVGATSPMPLLATQAADEDE